MAKLVWRVNLIIESEPGIVSETEVARVGFCQPCARESDLVAR